MKVKYSVLSIYYTYPAGRGSLLLAVSELAVELSLLAGGGGGGAVPSFAAVKIRIVY